MTAEVASPFVRSDFQRTHALLSLDPSFASATWSELEKCASDVVTASHGKTVPRWIVDLTPLTELGSGGMAFLLRLWKDLGLRPGTFSLACPSHHARETLSAAGMSRHWAIVESRDAALRQAGVRVVEDGRSSGIFNGPVKTNGARPHSGTGPEPSGIPPAVPGPSLTPGRNGDRREPQALRQELMQILEIAGAGAFIDLLFDRAFSLHATDIHFDPHEDGMYLRFRVDGLMHEIAILPLGTAVQAISRLKLLAQMDITEKRLAQDGHIAHPSKRHHADVRIGSGPTVHGERVVLRLMPDASHFIGLGDLGLTERQRASIEKGVSAPSGIMLFVGPVGSGKSTTTYTCLSLLNRPERSVVTIEDPVERRMHGVNQIQIDPKIDFGFAAALRGVLRQDPDVIMVGEIRDAETAHIAVRASLTGVRVLSTLHASDTSAVIDVLRQFGIPPMFAADSLTCAVAQRLVRKVCGVSHETFTPDAAMAAILKLSPENAANVRLTRGIPSDVNFFTGYNGRTGIYEVMTMDPDIRLAILNNEPSQEISAMARLNGMMTLEEAAIQKVLDGQTTVEEMLRVLTV